MERWVTGLPLCHILSEHLCNIRHLPVNSEIDRCDTARLVEMCKHHPLIWLEFEKLVTPLISLNEFQVFLPVEHQHNKRVSEVRESLFLLVKRLEHGVAEFCPKFK